MPCDTIYGLVGIAPDTEETIRSIKGRGESKPFLQLVGDASWVQRYSTMPVPAALRQLWPGPLTLIFPSIGGGTAAFRVPNDGLLVSVLSRVGSPVFSTSVNRSGESPRGRISEIVGRFEHEVSLVVDAGDLENRLPSTIVDLTTKPYTVVRQGCLHIPPELLRTDAR